VSTHDLPLATRLWFAWLCFFRVLFDAPFAARVWGARQAPALPAQGEAAGPEPVASAVTPVAALQLLSLLQREGRFVDFLEQDIGAFSDADVGAAARVVHDGCQRALRAHAQVEPVRTENEGSAVTLPAGFDADTVRLVGEVKGQAPYKGVLRHRGWRATRLVLPQAIGVHDLGILAPAEVELG
jgi:hypothetical protein